MRSVDSAIAWREVRKLMVLSVGVGEKSQSLERNVVVHVVEVGRFFQRGWT